MKRFKDYFVELSLIVLGVLIAISVDDYRERSKTRKMLQSYFSVMKNDLSANLQLIDEEIFYDSITLDRLTFLQEKVHKKDYSNLDTLTVQLFYNSAFTINDTGFRMIVQSGESHFIETEKLALLNNLFGATMTDLSFFEIHDRHLAESIHAFMSKYHTRVGPLLSQKDMEFSIEFLNLLQARIFTMVAELQQKKKMKMKMVEVITIF